MVTLKLTSSTVTVLDEKLNGIVTNRRLYGDEKQEIREWLPYLSYISRHPRSLINTGIYDMMPEMAADLAAYDHCLLGGGTVANGACVRVNNLCLQWNPADRRLSGTICNFVKIEHAIISKTFCIFY